MKTYSDDMAPHFRDMLEQRAARLRYVLAAARPEAEDGTGEVSDFKELAMEQAEATVADEQADRATLELVQVSTAQRRLASQSFGYCLECGHAIDLRRLEALPFTPFCTSCQTARERGARSAVA